MELWDSDDVCEWLDELDLEEHCESFRNNNIRGKQLLSFNKSDLQVNIAKFLREDFLVL